MPINYKPTKYAFFTSDEEITEQEHLDSCDINKMVKNAARGHHVNGNPYPQQYGYDDTTMDGVTHRINKQKLEAELQETAKTTEFSDEELKLIPESIKKKFKFKTKQKAKNDDLNDEKMPNYKNNKISNDSKKSDASKLAPNSQPAGASTNGEADA